MSPVEAIHGTGGAYVPCFEEPAELPPLPAGAIVGHNVGFVAKDELAAALPTTPYGAIRGSQVGFVPKPCQTAQLLAGWRGTRILSASAMGGPTSVYAGPSYVGASVLGALWSSYDVTTSATQGTRELEKRTWLTWIVPLTATTVYVSGTALAVAPEVDLETIGRPQDTTVDYEMGPSSHDPDIAPPDFDDTGTGHDGSVTYLDTGPQIPVAIGFSSSAFSGTWLDVFGDYGPPGETWRLFQLSLKNVSPVGIGRHNYFFAPGHDNGSVIDVIDRFPDNPNWLLGFDPPPFDYVDVSEVSSGLTVSLEVSY